MQGGEFVNLVVPSGSGKVPFSPTGGFGRFQPGQVLIDRLPVDGVQAGPIAFTFARETLLPWRTAAANVESAMEMHGGRPSSMP